MTSPRLCSSVLPLLLFILLASCVVDHAERVYMTLPPAAQKPALLQQIPSRPYEVVADIQWIGKSLDKLVQRAQTLGGDAVVVQFLGGNVMYSSVTTDQARQQSTTFSRLSGTVIKYKN